MRVQSPGQEDPLQEEMASHSTLLAWNPTDTGAWRAAVCGVEKSRTQRSTLAPACILRAQRNQPEADSTSPPCTNVFAHGFPV